MTPTGTDKTRTDSSGVSQTRIRTVAGGYGIEGLASAHKDQATGQWRSSVRLSSPPLPQEGWPEETYDALVSVVSETVAEARRLAIERSSTANPEP